MIGGGILKRKCPICNNPLPEEAHFCLHCFHDFNETQDDNKKAKLPLLEKIKQNKKAIILISAILILLIAVATACGIYYSGENAGNDTSAQTVTTEKHAVSTITEEDGSVVTTYDDGSIETVKADGTVITEEADGTVVTEKTDGTVITEKTDGTVITKEPDGTTITEKPDGTTEVTQKPTETTSENDTTEPPATEPSTEAPPSDYSDIPINYDDFTFEYRNGLPVIKKYNGEDKIVRVPSSYNGAPVIWVDSMAFQAVYEVEQIIFEMSPSERLGLSNDAIWLCKNLNTIIFIRPEGNSAKLNLNGGFAGNCSSLTDIQFYNCPEYRIYKNGIYYHDSDKDEYRLRYYLEGSDASEWVMPDWCEGADTDVFKYNSKIKSVYINSLNNFGLHFYSSSYMNAIYVNDENKYLFDDNGVAVYNNTMKELQFFSATANIKEYTIKSGYCFNPNRGLQTTAEINPHLEILRIPKDSDFYESCISKYFTSSKSNLKTIYIEEGHPKIDFIEENFKGEIIIY